MAKYLIDANLPYRFSIWSGREYVHVYDIDDALPDSKIWEYAREKDLTIITKDTDFSDRIILGNPPPRVLHIKVGNLKMKPFYDLMVKVWPEVCRLSEQFKLVRVYVERLEGID